MTITMADITAKRKRLWEKNHNYELDRELVHAVAVKILSEDSLIKEVRDRPYLLIEATFHIVDKRRETVPFFLNDVQRDFIKQLELRGTKRPYFILKGRQQGFTSLITAIMLSYSIVRKNFAGYTLADKSSNSVTIFNDKARMVYDRLPAELKPSEKFNSRNEIFFDKLNSSWRIDTATDQVGRSRTLNCVHFSEVGFYQCSLTNLQAAIRPAIVPNALIVYETTANGFNEAKELWDSESCINLFYEWWRSSEYRSTEYEYLEFQDAWLEQRKQLLTELRCDKEQITWYCKTYSEYIDESLICQEYPITPEEAFVSSCKSIFDKEAVVAQIARVAKLTGKLGYFKYRKWCKPIYNDTGELLDAEWHIDDIEFVERRDGYITIHAMPLKKYDREGNVTELAPYVIGGDTAGTGEDYFTAKVICNLDGRTVATLRIQQIDEDLYAEQIYCLAKYYNEAMVGIEINYSRQPTRVLAHKYRYPVMYMREVLNKTYDKVEMDYGFDTTSQTRPIIVSNLVEIMRDNPTLEVDRQTLKEMTTFVKKKNGRQEALSGEHDDLVMALAIAHFISKQHPHSWVKVKQPEDDFIETYFSQVNSESEDYITWEN